MVRLHKPSQKSPDRKGESSNCWLVCSGTVQSSSVVESLRSSSFCGTSRRASERERETKLDDKAHSLIRKREYSREGGRGC